MGAVAAAVVAAVAAVAAARAVAPAVAAAVAAANRGKQRLSCAPLAGNVDGNNIRWPLAQLTIMMVKW